MRIVGHKVGRVNTEISGVKRWGGKEGLPGRGSWCFKLINALLASAKQHHKFLSSAADAYLPFAKSSSSCCGEAVDDDDDADERVV